MGAIWTPQDYDLPLDRADGYEQVPLSTLVDAYLDVSQELFEARNGVGTHPGEGAELAELALGAAVARRVTQGRCVAIRDALDAGASWTQVASALDATEASVKAEFAAWIDGQAQLFTTYGKYGLDVAEEAAARRHLAPAL